MGKSDNGNGRDASSLILPSEPIEYVLGGIKLAMNATPVLLIQGPEFESTGGWARHPQAVAVFAAAAIEIKTLRAELDELREHIQSFAAFYVSDESGKEAREHIEPDPDEAERDYRDRVRKVGSYIETIRMDAGAIAAMAGLDKTPCFGPGGQSPSLGDLRKMESWLNRHGGVGWMQWNG